MKNPAASAAADRDWWWIFDPRLSLRAAFALALGGGTLLLTLLIAWIASVMLRRSLEAQLGAEFETLAVQVTDKIDRTIYERYRTLELAANLTPLRNGETAPAERRRVLEALRDSSPDFAWIGFLDARGRVVAATGGQAEGAAMGERSWFLLARERPYAGGPHEPADPARTVAPDDDNDESAKILDLGVPVTGLSGQFAGVICAQLRWAWTRDVHTSVVSETARRERVGVTLYGQKHEVLLDSGVSGWTQPPDPPAIAEGRRWRGWLIEDSSVGTRYLTGFARSRGFREYRGLGWTATVRQPFVRAFAPVDTLQRSILHWAVLLVVLVTAAAWSVGGRYARRLRSIAAAANRIREGDVLTVLPRPRGDSELARMCAALGDMVDDFRAKQPSGNEPREQTTTTNANPPSGSGH